MTDIVDGGQGGAADRQQMVFNAPPELRIDTRFPHKSLFGLLVKNKIFTFLTLSIYRFWAKTHLRRMLWNCFSVDGDRFEYHGTAKELFIGFLIAIALLLPYFLVLNLVQGFFSVENLAAAAFISVLNILILFSLWQFARYRLWRYRMSRTTWRGVRFYLTGKAMTYVGITLAWTFVQLITLGWAYPWLKAAQLKYQWGNSRFGDGKFDFEGTAREIFKIFWLPALISQIALVPIILVLLSLDFDQLLAGQAVMAGRDPVASGSFIALGLVIAILAMLYYKAIEIRYVTSRLSFGEARMSSRLGGGILIRIGFITLLAFVVFIVVMTLVGAVVFGVVGLGIGLSSPTSAAFMTQIAIVGQVIIFLLFFDILKFFFILLPLSKKICETTTISGFEAFEAAAQNAETSPKYGEGFADALDVGAF